MWISRNGALQSTYELDLVTISNFSTGCKILLKCQSQFRSLDLRRGTLGKQQEYGGKALLAPCKLSFANRSENLRESRLYVNAEVKRIQ